MLEKEEKSSIEKLEDSIHLLKRQIEIGEKEGHIGFITAMKLSDIADQIENNLNDYLSW